MDPILAMDSYFQLKFDEIFRKFDEIESRWDRRFPVTRAAPEQPPETLCVDALKQIDTEVVADNWGGLFEPAPVPEERVFDPTATALASSPSTKEPQGAAVVADNWGGLFDEMPAAAATTTDSVALLVDVAALEYTSTAVEPEESLPEEYPLQIQKREEQLEVVKLDEKVLQSTGSEALKADGSALGRNCLAQGAFSAPHAPRRAPLCWPRLGQPRHAPPLRRPWRPTPRPPRPRRRRRDTLRLRRLHRPPRPPPRLPKLQRPRRAPPRRRGRPPRPRVRGHRPLQRGLRAVDIRTSGHTSFLPTMVTSSPTCTLPLVELSTVWVTASSKLATISIHAQMVLDEMPNHTEPPKASEPAPVFASQCAALTSAEVLHDRTAVRGAALSSMGGQGLAIFHDTSVLQAEELLSCGGDFSNPCDFNLIGALVLFVRSCDKNMVNLRLLSLSDWVEQQPWPPPSMQVEFVCRSTAIQPTPWPPPECIEAINEDIFATLQESVRCSVYVLNFCQELIYLGSYARGQVTVIPLLSRGQGFQFRMLNENEFCDVVLLVFGALLVAQLVIVDSCGNLLMLAMDFLLEALSIFCEMLHTGICPTCLSVISILMIFSVSASLCTPSVFDKLPTRCDAIVFLPLSKGIALFGPVSDLQEIPVVFGKLAMHIISEIPWPPPVQISHMLYIASVPSAQSMVDKGIQSYFSPPTCCCWDAVLYREHRQWPPPTELGLVNCEAVLHSLLWLFSDPLVAKVSWWPFMLFEFKGGAVHLSPLPWPFFCGSAEAVQSSESVVQIVVCPILMHEISAANRDHCLVSVQNEGKLLNSDAVFHKLISGLSVVLNTSELCDQVLPLSGYKAQLYEYLRSRMNTTVPNLTALVDESVGCSRSKCKVSYMCAMPLLTGQYLGSYTRVLVPVLWMLSRGKGFKFRVLNEDKSRDAVLLVFANKQDLPHALNVTEITNKLGRFSLNQHHWYIENNCAPAIHFYGLAMEDDPPDAAEYVPTLQMQELSADDGGGDVAQCITSQAVRSGRVGSVYIGGMYADKEEGFLVTLGLDWVAVPNKPPWPPPNQLEVLSETHSRSSWRVWRCATSRTWPRRMRAGRRSPLNNRSNGRSHQRLEGKPQLKEGGNVSNHLTGGAKPSRHSLAKSHVQHNLATKGRTRGGQGTINQITKPITFTLFVLE